MEISLDTRLICITDGETEYFGSDQQWFASHWHRVSGCAPATAALIASYMAAAFPESCSGLYRYVLPARKDDFSAHMAVVREFVTPGAMGLTDPKEFAADMLSFARSCGAHIFAQQISPKLSCGVAFGFFREALRRGYLPALLLLRNPSPELGDFTWHWMAVTGCDTEKRTLTISSCGERHEIAFDRAWVQKKPYRAAGVYFYPA
jgi:hypothetical protein